MIIPSPPWWLIPALLALIITLKFAPAYGQTPDEWFRIVTEMQRRGDELDAEERKFVAMVVNYLAAKDDAVPTPDHKVWLLHIRQRLKIQ